MNIDIQFIIIIYAKLNENMSFYCYFFSAVNDLLESNFSARII